jgi:hypothetical protein
MLKCGRWTGSGGIESMNRLCVGRKEMILILSVGIQNITPIIN